MTSHICARRQVGVVATVAALLLGLISAPQAQPRSAGAGNVLCSQYIKAARSSDIVYHQASNWLLGYVSGMNAALEASKAAAPVNLSNDQLLKSAGDYCEANPGSTIAVAASQWYAALPKSEQPQPPTQERGMWLRLEPSKTKTLMEKH